MIAPFKIETTLTSEMTRAHSTTGTELWMNSANSGSLHSPPHYRTQDFFFAFQNAVATNLPTSAEKDGRLGDIPGMRVMLLGIEPSNAPECKARAL